MDHLRWPFFIFLFYFSILLSTYFTASSTVFIFSASSTCISNASSISIMIWNKSRESTPKSSKDVSNLTSPSSNLIVLL